MRKMSAFYAILKYLSIKEKHLKKPDRNNCSILFQTLKVTVYKGSVPFNLLLEHLHGGQLEIKPD